MSAPDHDPGNLTIILEGFAPDSGHDPVAGLQKFFGIDANTARQFVENTPVVVKSKATRAIARQYVQTLHTIGARVRVEGEAAPPGGEAGPPPAAAPDDPPAPQPDSAQVAEQASPAQPPTDEPDAESPAPSSPEAQAPSPSSRANIGRVNTREMAVIRRRPIETPGRPAPLLEKEARDAANRQAAARQADFKDTQVVTDQEPAPNPEEAPVNAALWGAVPSQGWGSLLEDDEPSSADGPHVILGGADLDQPPPSSQARPADYNASALRRKNTPGAAASAPQPSNAERSADQSSGFVVQRMDDYWANQSQIPDEPTDGLTVDAYLNDSEEFVIEDNTAQIDISRFQRQIDEGLSVDDALMTSALDDPAPRERPPSAVTEAPQRAEEEDEEALLKLVFEEEDDFQEPPALQDEPDDLFARNDSVDDDLFALGEIPSSVAGQWPTRPSSNPDAPARSPDALFDDFEDPFNSAALPHAKQPGQTSAPAASPLSGSPPRADTAAAAMPTPGSPFTEATAGTPQSSVSGPSTRTRPAQRVFIPDSDPDGEGLALPDLAVGHAKPHARQQRGARPNLYDHRATPDELRSHHPFWASLPKALKAPIVGTLSWYLAIPAVSLLAGCLSIGGVFAGPVFSLIIVALASSLILGMLGNYFIASVDQSMQGTFEAPPLPSLDGDALNQFVVRGLAVYGLLAVLFVAPMLIIIPAVQMTDAPPNLSATSQLDDTGDEHETKKDDTNQPWNPDDVFYDENGDKLRVPVDSPARVLRTKDGRQVLVDPRRRIVRLMGDDMPEPQVGGGPAAAFQETSIPQPTVPMAPLMLSGLLIGLILLYTPMALTIGALNANILQMYNPIMVFKGIFRGGVKYLFVAFSGVVISGALSAAAAAVLPMVSSLGSGAALCVLPVALLMPSSIYIYTIGVQGHLMGLLIAENPDDFGEFSA